MDDAEAELGVLPDVPVEAVPVVPPGVAPGAGQVTASKTYTLAAASGAAASGEATINGAHHVLIANGVWAGFWLPTSSVPLLSLPCASIAT